MKILILGSYPALSWTSSKTWRWEDVRWWCLEGLEIFKVMGKGFEGREVPEQRWNIPKQSFLWLWGESRTFLPLLLEIWQGASLCVRTSPCSSGKELSCGITHPKEGKGKLNSWKWQEGGFLWAAEIPGRSCWSWGSIWQRRRELPALMPFSLITLQRKEIRENHSNYRWLDLVIRI